MIFDDCYDIDDDELSLIFRRCQIFDDDGVSSERTGFPYDQTSASPNLPLCAAFLYL